MENLFLQNLDADLKKSNQALTGNVEFARTLARQLLEVYELRTEERRFLNDHVSISIRDGGRDAVIEMTAKTNCVVIEFKTRYHITHSYLGIDYTDLKRKSQSAKAVRALEAKYPLVSRAKAVELTEKALTKKAKAKGCTVKTSYDGACGDKITLTFEVSKQDKQLHAKISELNTLLRLENTRVRLGI